MKFENPVQADHCGHPVLGQLGLKAFLIKLGVAETGELRSLSSHALDESLLAYDDLSHVAELDLADEFQAFL